MQTTHAKHFRISTNSFTHLVEGMKKHLYCPERREGFIIDDAPELFDQPAPGRVAGRYMHCKLVKIVDHDAHDLSPAEVLKEVMLVTHFEINITKRLIITDGNRSEIKALEEVFYGVAGVSCEMEEFNSDVVEIFRALRDATAGGRLDLNALKIKDYMGREGLIGTTNFKLLEPNREEEVFSRYQPEAQAVTASMVTDEGRQNITVRRNGTISVSDGFPRDMIELARGFLGQFHEVVEAEVVAI